MLIEIAGIPGSGKTTLYKHLAQELRRRDVAFTDAHTISNTRSGTGITLRYVKNKPQRALLYHFTRFITQNPKFFEKVWQAPYGEGNGEAKKFLVFLACVTFQMARALKKQNEMVFMDESFLSHCVSIYPKREQQSDLADLLSYAPKIDVLLHLETPADVAFDRAVARSGATEEVHTRVVNKFGDKSAFAVRANNFKVGIKSYKERGTIVFNVDATKSLGVAVENLACELIAMQAKGS